MNEKIFKILACGSTVIIISLNLYHAANFYHIGSIHLSDSFYWQSFADVVVDNKPDKKQTVTIVTTQHERLGTRSLNDTTILFISKRDSYHMDW